MYSPIAYMLAWIWCIKPTSISLCKCYKFNQHFPLTYIWFPVGDSLISIDTTDVHAKKVWLITKTLSNKFTLVDQDITPGVKGRVGVLVKMTSHLLSSYYKWLCFRTTPKTRTQNNQTGSVNNLHLDVTLWVLFNLICKS